jgi:hypothetical protein
MRPMTDVVVLLPGITGSVLRDDRGPGLWAPTARTATRALTSSPAIETEGEAGEGVLSACPIAVLAR